MIIATPALQLSVVNAAEDPQNPPAIQTGGQPVLCPNSSAQQSITFPGSTSNSALPFPVGVTTAAIIFIAALSTTDLTVNIGGVQIPIPARQGFVLYGLTSGQFSLSTALGGEVQYWIGG